MRIVLLFPTPQTTTLQGSKLDLFIAKISAPPAPVLSGSCTWHYAYDGLSRLVSACSQWDASTSTCLGESFSYSYDGAGNAQSFSRWSGSEVETVSFVYNGANQIACRDDGNGLCGDAGDVPYAYDAYGNLTGDGRMTYTYDAENRLVNVTDGVSITTYTYNGDGERMAQTLDGVTTSYVLDTAAPLTMVLAETTGADTIYYLHGLDLVAQSDGVTVEFFGYDGLGSVRQMLDSTGNVLFAQVFDPYGNEYASMGTESPGWGFTGEQTDRNGLVYLRARYYNPRQGRFTSRDAWPGEHQKPLSLNPWIYANNNPGNMTDPSGMAPECDPYQRADLTQWLIDEMNTNRVEWIAGIIRIAVQQAHLTNPENPLSGELGALAVAYLTFYDVVKTNGLWDFKWAIENRIGGNIRIADNWYRNDLPGNINYGYIGLAVGFNEKTLHCGADFAENRRWCSGSDPARDYEAIEAGYDIWKITRGGPVNEDVLQIAIGLHPQIPEGSEEEPDIKSLSLNWPYQVGTFDDGSSGWWIKNRNWWDWKPKERTP